MFSAALFDESFFDESAFDDAAFDDALFEEAAFDEAFFDDAAFDDVAFDDVSFDDTFFEEALSDEAVFSLPAKEAPEEADCDSVSLAGTASLTCGEASAGALASEVVSAVLPHPERSNIKAANTAESCLFIVAHAPCKK